MTTKTRHHLLLGIALALAGVGMARAQVAGATSLGATTTETQQVVSGWSARQSILGRSVYDASGDRIGKALDLIVGTDKRVSHLIVGTGAAVGAAEHLVAVPAARVQVQGARIVLPEANRQTLASQPAFLYAPITRTQSSVVDRAQKDVDKARQAIARLERKSAQGGAEARERADGQVLELRQNQQAVEDRIADMDGADAAQWTAREAEVAQASQRLRSAIRRASM